jgi:hypothetical protein
MTDFKAFYFGIISQPGTAGTSLLKSPVPPPKEIFMNMSHLGFNK